jgi:transposase
MRPPLIVKLRGRQRARLEAWYRQTDCPRTRLRIQMVLLAAQGYSVAEIGPITRHSAHTVRRWLQRFSDQGCTGLQEGVHTGRPRQVTPAVDDFLRACLLRPPREFGIRRPTWIARDLAQLVRRQFRIRVSAECIRRHLQQLGFVCRRPTWTVKHLAQQQPGYAQKKPRLLGS